MQAVLSSKNSYSMLKFKKSLQKKKKLDIWIHILSFIDDKKDTILSFIDDKKNIILSFMDDKGTDKSIVVYNQFCAFWCKHEHLFISKEMRTQSEGVLK